MRHGVACTGELRGYDDALHIEKQKISHRWDSYHATTEWKTITFF